MMKLTKGVPLILVVVLGIVVLARDRERTTSTPVLLGARVTDGVRPPDSEVPTPTDVPDLDGRVAYASSGLAPDDTTSFDAGHGARERPIGNCTLSGRVVDDLGAPIDTFHVVARPTASRDARQQFENSAGAFSLGGLHEGTWTVVARLRDPAAHDAPYDVVAQEWSAPVEVVLRDNEECEVELVLPRSGWLEGTVVDDRGRPIRAQLIVQVEMPGIPYDNADWWRPGPTDDGGTFSMPLMSGVAYIFARAEGYAASEVQVRPVEPGARTNVALQLRTGAAIEVELRDSLGQPVAGREVDVEEWDYLYYDKLTTDAAGRVVFEFAPPGSYTAHVTEVVTTTDEAEWTEYSSTLCRERFTIERLERVKKVALVLPAMREVDVAGKLRGFSSATDAEGDFSVALGFEEVDGGRQVDARLNADGTYDATLPAPGRYEMEYEMRKSSGSRSYCQRIVEVPDLSACRIDIDFDGGVVPGRVVDANGMPMVGVDITAHSRSDDGTWKGGEAESDARGWFDLHLVAGAYEITARAKEPGYASAALENVVVAPGSHTDALELVLERGGTIRGVLLDHAGEPIHDGFVVSAGARGAWSSTDGRGRFQLVGVPAGRARLLGYANDDRHAGTRIVDVVADETQELEFALVEARPVWIRVRNRDGESVEADVTLPQIPESRAWLRDGLHFLGALPFGAYRAHIVFEAQVIDTDFVVGEATDRVDLEVRFD